MSNDAAYLETLKKEKNAVILAHYYVDSQVQELADYIGDSYYLSKLATELEEDVIVLCGVSFMGESVKLLNPEKTVLLPDENADCPMAHMAEKEDIERIKSKYDDVSVVCYVNSTAEIKQYADVCVTSSNALAVVSNLESKYIYFIPDQNLGRYIASKVPDKQFIFHDGFCHVHTSIYAEDVKRAKELHPEAQILAHPECTGEVLELADYVGSTSGIISYATASTASSFIICTEMGVFFDLMQKNPEKKFYSVGHRQFCPNMKRITLDKVIACLETMQPEVQMEEHIIQQSSVPLNRMLELAERGVS